MEKQDRENEEQEMGHFELGYLLFPAIVEENLALEAAAIREVIEGNGVIVSGAAPIEKHLAYKIVKRAGGKYMRFVKAYFGHFIFRATVDGMTEIGETIKKNDHVLRSLLIKRTRESLIAPIRRIPRAPEMRPKRAAEKSAPINEAEIDKEIEKMVAAAE